MNQLNIITSGSPPTGYSLKELAKKEGSPCIKCLVKASCRKSFVDQSACKPFAVFIQQIMMNAGILNENKD